MRGDKIAAVDRRRDGGADLQRGHGHGLTEGGGRKLDLPQLVLGVILHHARLIGQVHAGALGEAEGVEVVIKDAGAEPLPQLDEVDVAAVAEGLGKVLDSVRLLSGADLKDASGVVQLGDGLVLPLDVAVGTGVVRVRVGDLLAVLVQQEFFGVVRVLEVDGIDLRLGLNLLAQIGQVRAEIQRVIGVEVGLGGHCKDGTRLDIHDDGRTSVLDVVGVMVRPLTPARVES